MLCTKCDRGSGQRQVVEILRQVGSEGYFWISISVCTTWCIYDVCDVYMLCMVWV